MSWDRDRWTGKYDTPPKNVDESGSEASKADSRSGR